MNILDQPQYRFLQTDPRLGRNVIFLTYGGSYAYGTNVEGSDIDIRGCTLNSKADLLGMGSFEQVVDDHTDTTVYGFNKLLGLLINCNPNTIELLGCKPEHYFVLTPIGKQLIDRRKMFLSRRAVNSFGGYAGQQLRRLENALVHDAYPAEVKRADSMGQAPEKVKNCLTELDEIKAKAEQILVERQCLTLKDLAVDGRDVIATGIEPGPEVGRIMKNFLEQVLDGKSQTNSQPCLN